MIRNFLVTLIVAIAVPLANVAAQEPGQRLSPIRVALVSQLEQAGARAMIVRGVGKHNQDLIFVTNETTGADLALAAYTLLRARGSTLLRTSEEVRAYIQPSSKSAVPGAVYSTKLLAELKRAPVRPVRGFGNLRTLEMDIRVPPKRAQAEKCC